MEYKISELVAKTHVPKSTILYYIKEGILPEANKIKSNVHRYNDEHLELIRYIAYMKENFGTSNEQLKDVLQNKNQSFSTSLNRWSQLQKFQLQLVVQILECHEMEFFLVVPVLQSL